MGVARRDGGGGASGRIAAPAGAARLGSTVGARLRGYARADPRPVTGPGPPHAAAPPGYSPGDRAHLAIALWPGSLDPVTHGHVDIIERNGREIDEDIIAEV